MSSIGRWAVLQLPCRPSKQGELSENILQHRFNKLSPQTVVLGQKPRRTCWLFESEHRKPKENFQVAQQRRAVVQGGPSGRGHHFVDIKLRILPVALYPQTGAQLPDKM